MNVKIKSCCSRLLCYYVQCVQTKII
jgi:hypothetical protein